MNKEYIKEIAKELKITDDQAIWWWKWFLENNEEHEAIKGKEVAELTEEELEIVIEVIRKQRRKGRGIPIPPEMLSLDESKAGEMININDWEEEE